MVFDSLEFFLFLAIAYGLYRVLPFRGQNLMLLGASYLFYGWWDARFLFLIVLSTVVDFCCGLLIDRGQLTPLERRFPSFYLVFAALAFLTVRWDAVRLSPTFPVLTVDWGQILPATPSAWLPLFGTILLVVGVNGLYPRLMAIAPDPRRRTFLILSIATNLGILGVFKYFNFFIDSAGFLLGTIDARPELWSLNIILPVGISFYTFQTMSYTIDIYRGEMKAARHFLDFALFVSFFPQLVAGPIERASRLLPKILQVRRLNGEQTFRGLFLILFGLFKKVAIADSVAVSVNAVYESTGTVSWLDVVLATGLFAVQVYCDFSGYSDIARGTAKLFGIDLMPNFKLPYFAKNPSDFWRRWHISLSTWLRDYLYIPLGGSRRGTVKTYRNLMLTMFLGGLWHGAAWHFVLWGVYQGGLLCAHRAVSPKHSAQADQRPQPSGFSLPAALRGTVVTLAFLGITCYGWLLFRANSLGQAFDFTQILIANIGNFSLTMPRPTLAGLLGLPVLIGFEAVEYFSGTAHFYAQLMPMIRGITYAALVVLILMGTSNASTQFIYFQF